MEQVVGAVARPISAAAPLTIDERKVIAGRMLALRPEASDRAVADWCRLSAKTVAVVRRAAGGEVEAVAHRVGRDGRRRPVDPDGPRRRVADILARDPGAPVRRVAAQAETSPATVLDVRRRLARGEGPVPGAPVPTADAALLAMPDGDELISWFASKGVDDAALARLAEAVPRGRVYVMADEARSRAASWARFAALVEGRSRPTISRA